MKEFCDGQERVRVVIATAIASALMMDTITMTGFGAVAARSASYISWHA